ncbi:MAG: hypothetical protein AMXMBFR12_02810 [Candidatus Babeliales bacterium]
MVFIYLFVACFFIPILNMDRGFVSLGQDINYTGDLIPVFEPSEQAVQYKVLQNANCYTNLEKIVPQLSYEKKSAFIECMEQIRASHVSTSTLKYILEDPVLVEAVIAYAPHYTVRNGFIQLFFFSSLLYQNDSIYALLLDKKIDLVILRSMQGQTPAEFVRWLTRKNE